MPAGPHPVLRAVTLLMLIFALLGTPALARALQVVVVTAEPEAACNAFSDALLSDGQQHGHQYRRIHLAPRSTPDTDDMAVLAAADLLIGCGGMATEALLEMETQAEAGAARASLPPILATLVSRSQFEQLSLRTPPERLSAIVLDQPMSRHVALIRAMLPDAGRLGFLFSAASLHLEDELREAATNRTLKTNTRRISTPNELLGALDGILSSSDGLLILPDPVTAAPTLARPILLSSYRYRKPVFAYSRAYVEAGALAAVFSTPEDIARDLADLLKHWTALPDTLPPARAPERFSIATNAQVARALGLNLPTEATLQARLHQEERAP